MFDVDNGIVLCGVCHDSVTLHEVHYAWLLLSVIGSKLKIPSPLYGIANRKCIYKIWQEEYMAKREAHKQGVIERRNARVAARRAAKLAIE